MAEEGKDSGFIGIIKTGINYISQIISASVFPSVAEGADMIMDRVEERMIKYEKRLIRKMSSLMTMGFGAVFLVFALVFYLIEYLRWSKALAFFSIGMTVLVIGLLMRLRESDK